MGPLVVVVVCLGWAPGAAAQHEPPNATPGEVQLGLVAAGRSGTAVTIQASYSTTAYHDQQCAQFGPCGGNQYLPYTIDIYLDRPDGTPLASGYFGPAIGVPHCQEASVRDGPTVTCDAGGRNVNDPAAALPGAGTISFTVGIGVPRGSTAEIVVEGYGLNSWATVPLPSPRDAFVDLRTALKDVEQTSARKRFTAALADCRLTQDILSGIPGGRLALVGPDMTALCEQDARDAYQAARAKIDPRDVNFNAVALPGPVTGPATRSRCAARRGIELRECRAIATAAARYTTASAAWSSIVAAVVTAMNRGNTAEAAGVSQGILIQELALVVYAVEQNTAGRALHAAGVGLAAALARAHLNPRISAVQAAAEMQRELAGTFPKPVQRDLAAGGITRAELHAALSATVGDLKPGALELASVVAAPTPTALIPGSDLPLTAANLSALVVAVQRGGGLTATQANELLLDVGAYQNAGAAQKRAALSRLRGAIGLLGPSAGAFFTAALTELS